MDDIFDFSRCVIALMLDDLASKNDVLEVEDREFVIVKLNLTADMKTEWAV